MENYQEWEGKLTSALGLSRRPVAVSIVSEPPASVPVFEGSAPSGCSFWRLASEGRVFATLPEDHYNCPIGSYTHNIALPESRQSELTNILSTMTDLGYLRMEEVPGIPRLKSTPGAVVYAPLGDAPLKPDVVIVTGKPARMMLLIEAASRAGAAPRLPVLARPTCMAIPAAMDKGVVTSTGCIGNRVYTDIGEDELYTVVNAADFPRVMEALDTIVDANAQLEKYHRDRRAHIATA